MFSMLLELLSNLFFSILHVTGAGSFPKPLTAKEEADCLLRMKNGDMQARSLLIERNLRLVAHIIKKYYAGNNDQDDLISIGTIGLIKAVDTFDADKNIRLSSYASRCIENVILTQRLYSISNRETVSLLLCAGRSGSRKTITYLFSTERFLALSPMRRFTFCGFLFIR